MNVEWIDKIPKKEPWPHPNPLEPNPVMGKCPQCGIELRQIMFYVCQQQNCPTGLGGTQVTW